MVGQMFRQPVVTVTSPDYATVDLTRPTFSERVQDLSAGQDGMSVEMMGDFSEMPTVRRATLIDRVRSEPQDDNQENCIQICKEILTRSTSISCPSTSFEGITPARRGSVKSCSPLAVSEGMPRSLTPSSSSSSSSSSESPQVFQRLQRQGSSPAAQIHHNSSINSSNNNHSMSNATNTLRSEAAAFPPTPPSEDMML